MLSAGGELVTVVPGADRPTGSATSVLDHLRRHATPRSETVRLRRRAGALPRLRRGGVRGCRRERGQDLLHRSRASSATRPPKALADSWACTPSATCCATTRAGTPARGELTDLAYAADGRPGHGAGPGRPHRVRRPSSRPGGIFDGHRDRRVRRSADADVLLQGQATTPARSSRAGVACSPARSASSRGKRQLTHPDLRDVRPRRRGRRRAACGRLRRTLIPIYPATKDLRPGRSRSASASSLDTLGRAGATRCRTTSARATRSWTSPRLSG